MEDLGLIKIISKITSFLSSLYKRTRNVSIGYCSVTTGDDGVEIRVEIKNNTDFHIQIESIVTEAGNMRLGYLGSECQGRVIFSWYGAQV